MLDQMTKGRAFVGFARGYQPRWVNTLGQHYPGLTESFTDPENYEKLKKELYEEHFEIIMKAWTKPTFSHQGKDWQIPPANTFWAAHEVTRQSTQGVDDKGFIKEIGTVPEPYQKPHPPLFQPFSFSESSVKWAASTTSSRSRLSAIPKYAPGSSRLARTAARRWARIRFGQGIGLAREMVVADTDEEAFAMAREAGCFIWTKFFEPFGFNAAIARPGENYKDVPNTFESMVDRGLAICGSPDTVSRKLERCSRFCRPNISGPYLRRTGATEGDDATFELFTTKVLPRFTDKIR